MSAIHHVSTVEYRQVPGSLNYRVGSDGSVWSQFNYGPRSTTGRNWRLLRPSLDDHGYFVVNVKYTQGRKLKKVHQLVAEAFIGPCPEGQEVCHFPDNDPKNNRVENLRYGTKKENAAHRVIHGTEMIGVKNHRSKLDDDKVREIRKRCQSGEEQKSLAKEYGVPPSNISAIHLRKTWKHVL